MITDLCEVWEVPKYPSDIYRKAMGPISWASVFKFNAPSLEPPAPQPHNLRVEDEGDDANELAHANAQPKESRETEEGMRGAYP